MKSTRSRPRREAVVPMHRLFGLLRQYFKYLILVPLLLLAVAASSYIAERAVNRYYIGRDLRLLARAADLIAADYESQQQIASQGSNVDQSHCTVATRALNRKSFECPPDLEEQLVAHVSPLIRRNLFSVVLVADLSGSVKAQQPSSPRFVDVSGLLTTVSPGSAGSGKLSSDDFKQFASAGNVREIQFAGQTHWVFVQPFAAYEQDWSSRKVLALVGLLPSRSLWSAPLEFTQRSWVVGLLGMLGLLALLPLLKLAFGKPGSDLRPFEVFRFVFSLLTLAATATLGVLYLAFQHQRQVDVDDRLRALAGQVRVEASVELGRALQQLHAFDSRVDLSRWLEKFEPGVYYPRYDAATWVDKNGAQLIQYARKPVGYAQNLSDREYFKQLDRSGPWTVTLEGPRQDSLPANVVIQSINSRATSLPAAAIAIRSDSRQVAPEGRVPYITVMSIPFNSVMRPVLPDDYGFAVVDDVGKVQFHSDVSRGAGENILVETGNDALLYSSLVRRMTATFTAAYQGAPHRFYVSRFLQGTPWSLVVFHDLSSSRRLQLETLLNALILFCAYAIYLLVVTAVAYRIRFLIRNRKLSTWRFVAEDWAEDWLMAFHKRSTSRNVVLAITYVTFLLLLFRLTYSVSGAYLIAFMLLLQTVAAVIAWVPRDRTTDEQLKDVHSQEQRWVPCVALGALGSATLLYALIAKSGGELAIAVAIFALGGVLAWTQPERARQERSGSLARWTYLLPAALLSTLVSVAAACTIMAVAAGHSEYTELRTRQLAFFKALDETASYRNWARREGIYDTALFGARLQPLAPVASASLPGEPHSTESSDLWGVITHLPMSSSRNLSSSIDLHQDESHDGQWRWRMDQKLEAGSYGKYLVFEKRYALQRDRNGGAAGFRLTSPLPPRLTLRPDGMPYEGIWSMLVAWRFWLALGLIVGLLAWAIHHVIRRCLMLHLTTRCPDHLMHTGEEPDPVENTLVLSAAAYPTFEMQGRDWQYVDMRSATSRARFRELVAGLQQQSRIVFENVQSCLSKDEVAGSLLAHLEELTADRTRTVVLVSTTHPLHYLKTAEFPADTTLDPDRAQYLARWAALLANLSTEFYNTDVTLYGMTEAHAAWLDCSKAEHAILRQISKYSLTHPKNQAIVSDLLRRGLVMHDPVSRLLLVHPNVERYAETAYIRQVAPAGVNGVKDAKSGIVGVLSAVAIIVPLALFAFEQDMATKLATLLTAIIGIPMTINRWLTTDSGRPRSSTNT